MSLIRRLIVVIAVVAWIGGPALAETPCDPSPKLKQIAKDLAALSPLPESEVVDGVRVLLRYGVGRDRIVALISAASDIAVINGRGIEGFREAYVAIAMTAETGSPDVGHLGLGSGFEKSVRRLVTKDRDVIDAFLTALYRRTGKPLGALSEAAVKANKASR